MVIPLAEACMLFLCACARVCVCVYFFHSIAGGMLADDGILTLTHFHLTCVMYFSI